jgi:exopolysaccharide biosynthesis polyprenyl glycosylphosphotransferase
MSSDMPSDASLAPRATASAPPLSAPTAGVEADLDAARQQRVETRLLRDAIFRRALAFSDAVAVAVVLWLGALVFGEDSLTAPVLGAFALVIVVMKVVGLYDRDEQLVHKTTLDELPALFEVATLSTLLLWLLGDLIVVGDLGRRQILGMWILLIVLLVVGRALARNVASRLAPIERCLLLGDLEAGPELQQKLAISSSKAELVGALPVERVTNGSVPPEERVANGSVMTVPDIPAGLERVLAEHEVHRVILAPGRVPMDALLHTVRRLRSYDVSVSILPATPAVTGYSVEPDHLHGLTLLGTKSFEMTRSSRIIKRSFDLVASSLLLAALAPVLLAIALAIKVDSKGPVLFRQRRVGRDGDNFWMLKFRSMYVGSEHRREELRAMNEAEGLFKIENDPRITRVGRQIRRWSLDELPQLVNVLRGEMSLVGPRPLVPVEDSLVEGVYRRRLDLAPGITGYWQSLGASRIPLAEMVRLDYLYVASWSLWNDVRILLRTVPYVFGRRGR